MSLMENWGTLMKGAGTLERGHPAEEGVSASKRVTRMGKILGHRDRSVSEQERNFEAWPCLDGLEQKKNKRRRGREWRRRKCPWVSHMKTKKSLGAQEVFPKLPPPHFPEMPLHLR